MLLHYVGTTLKVSNKIKQGGKKIFNYSLKDFNLNWVVRLTMYWQAGVIRFTYMWKLWITADHLLREKMLFDLDLSNSRLSNACDQEANFRWILWYIRGYRYSFFLLSCIFIVVLFLLNIGLKFRLIFSLFIYS